MFWFLLRAFTVIYYCSVIHLVVLYTGRFNVSTKTKENLNLRYFLKLPRLQPIQPIRPELSSV